MRDHSRNATKKVPEGGGTHHMQAVEVPNRKFQKYQTEGGGDPPHASWREESIKSANYTEEGIHHMQAG